MISKICIIIAVVLFIIGAVGGTLFSHSGIELVSAGLGFFAGAELAEELLV